MLERVLAAAISVVLLSLVIWLVQWTTHRQAKRKTEGEIPEERWRLFLYTMIYWGVLLGLGVVLLLVFPSTLLIFFIMIFVALAGVLPFRFLVQRHLAKNRVCSTEAKSLSTRPTSKTAGPTQDAVRSQHPIPETPEAHKTGEHNPPTH